MSDAPPETVSLLRTRSRDRCLEFALVLVAMSIRCELVSDIDTYELRVRAEDAARAREQIRLYVEENGSAPRAAPQFGFQDGLTCAWLYAVTILLVYVLQRDQVFSIDWLAAGMNQAGLVQQGEWWRTVTALGLHVDTPHLFSNLCFGALFAFLAGEMLGWGIGWAGMILAGSLGNLVNSLAKVPTHTSIGASTAIFAAVGILAATSWSLREPGKRRWVPIGGGIALLAFIGMGGERTDIFAHVAGFAAGCLLGAGYGFLMRRITLTARQRTFVGIGATVFFTLTWVPAIATGQ